MSSVDKIKWAMSLRDPQYEALQYFDAISSKIEYRTCSKADAEKIASENCQNPHTISVDKSFTVKRNIMDFDVAASRIERYDAVNGKLLQVLDADALIVENPENMLAVSLLESIPEFSSDDAEFI